MYIKAEGSTIIQFPYTLTQLRSDNPNTSFPVRPSEELLAGYSVFPVLAASPPEHDQITQRAEAADPVYEQEEWRQSWEIVDLSEEEVQANVDAVRARATLTRMAFMLALEDAGLYDQVEAAVNSGQIEKRSKIMWDNASQFERMHPDLVAIATALGYTDEQMDGIFGINI